METLTHTLTRKTNYAWDDLGDLGGMPYLPTTNGNVLKARDVMRLHRVVPGDLWGGERGHLVQTAATLYFYYYFHISVCHQRTHVDEADGT